MSEFELFAPNILFAYLTYIIATSSPGPATLAIMQVSMSHGRASGIVFALGVVTGSISWAILAAIGFTKVLVSYGSALVFIKMAGAFYLFWLAYKSLRSALPNEVRHEKATPEKLADKALFLNGLGLHLTNPKAALAWIAIVSVGLQPDAPTWVTYAIITGCSFLGVLVFTLYALAFSNQRMINAYRSARKPIESLMASIFGLSGIKILSSHV